MVQRLIPGHGFVEETGSAQRLLPGHGFVDETVSVGGGTTIDCDIGTAAASGTTANIANGTTINCELGSTTATGLDATISNTSGATVNCDVGSAAADGLLAAVANGSSINCTIGSAAASGLDAIIANAVSFISDPLMNNTETATLSNLAVVWTWTANGRIGSMSGKTVLDGSGTTASDGRLLVTGMTSGAGKLDVSVLGATPAEDSVFTQYGTAA